MANFEVLKRIPDSYRKTYIDEGANAMCYRTSDGDVYKEFICGISEVNDLEMLSQIDNPYFAFPRKLVYLGEKTNDGLVGYRMDYVDGVPFSEISHKIPIQVLINASRNMERAIIDFTKQYSILLYDVNNKNVLFQSNNEFKIIDTDLFEYYILGGVYDNLKSNMKEWNEYMLYNLGCSYNAFYSEQLNLRFDIAISTGKICPSILINEIIEEIQEQTNGKVITLDDYNEGIKLIKVKR